jgi:hypothetical protein
MASWLTIYRAYDHEALVEELARLRKELRNPYASAGAGGSSSSRDMSLLQEQLDGATRAFNERSTRGSKRRALGVFR